MYYRVAEISDETKWKKTKYKSLSYGTTLLRVLGKHAPDDYGRIKSVEKQRPLLTFAERIYERKTEKGSSEEMGPKYFQAH